jgi:SynChlorMet cassette protein ScmD
MQASTRLTANPVVVLREEFDDWALLYNPDTSLVVGLSPSAVAVWKAIDGRRTAGEIAQETIDRYSAVPSTAPTEVMTLLDELCEQGFVGTPGD